MVQELVTWRGGMRIYGKIRFPEGEGPFPVAVFSHGFSAARVYDSEMAAEYAERGIAFAAFDFCGGGPASQSDGSMLEMSVLTEAADLEVVIEAVKVLDKVDSRNLFLVGSSQGGYVSAIVAARRPSEVRALVLNFPAFCIGDDAARRLGLDSIPEDVSSLEIPEEASVGGRVIGRRYIEDALATDAFEIIKGYSGDVLIIHGSDDEIVPAEYSLRAARLYGPAAKLVVLGGMNHGFRNALPMHYRQAQDLAIGFINDHLG